MAVGLQIGGQCYMCVLTLTATIPSFVFIVFEIKWKLSGMIEDQMYFFRTLVEVRSNGLPEYKVSILFNGFMLP